MKTRRSSIKRSLSKAKEQTKAWVRSSARPMAATAASIRCSQTNRLTRSRSKWRSYSRFTSRNAHSCGLWRGPARRPVSTVIGPRRNDIYFISLFVAEAMEAEIRELLEELGDDEETPQEQDIDKPEAPKPPASLFAAIGKIAKG